MIKKTFILFLCNVSATSEIYTLSLHDALPILETKERDPSIAAVVLECSMLPPYAKAVQEAVQLPVFDFITLISDRKSTRLNSSHVEISYAVFCLKKKKIIKRHKLKYFSSFYGT